MRIRSKSELTDHRFKTASSISPRSRIGTYFGAAALFLLGITTSGCATKSTRTRPLPTPNPASYKGQGGPTIAAIEGLVSNGVLTLRAGFASGDFDARTTRVAWVLDTDDDPATGWAGLFGAPGVRANGSGESSDIGVVGAEAVALLTGICDAGTLIRYDQEANSWVLADRLPMLVLRSGFQAYVALDSLPANPGTINFKVISYRYSGECPPKSINYQVRDIAPKLGAFPARAQQVTTTPLASPQPIAPADKARFDQYPRSTVLEWSAVGGAAAYLVQVQYADRTAPSGWRPLIFRRTSDLRTGFDFIGAQAGRWRVWALNQNGLAGTPNEWQTFRYAR